MPSKKDYDDIYSDKGGYSNLSDSDFYSDSEYIPRQRYELNWYEYNQEHILNIWDIIQKYIEENGLNLLEYGKITNFTSYVAHHSYRKECETRVHSKKN